MQRTLYLAALSLIGLAVAAGAFASSAKAFVYWAEFGGGQGTEIRRANLDGSVNRPFISNAQVPCGVAVDDQHIYWANLLGNSIGRANIDGTAVNQRFISLASGSEPCGVAVNGSQIWWASSQRGADSSSIGRANLDGTGVVPNLYNTPQVRLPCRVAVNSSHVYWVNNFGTTPNIWRAGLDGTPPPAEIIPDATPAGVGSRSACWPTLSGSRLYWFSSPEPAILSTDLDGNDRSLVLGASAAGGISIFGGQIYWGSPMEDSIFRANLDGSQPEAFTKATQPSGVAVDSGVPSNRFSFGKLRRNPGRGIALLLVKIPDPGRVSMLGAGAVRRRSAETVKSLAADPNGVLVKLRVKAKDKKLRKLDRTGKVRLRLKVTFSPTGGTARTKRRPVTLIER